MELKNVGLTKANLNDMRAAAQETNLLTKKRPCKMKLFAKSKREAVVEAFLTVKQHYIY